MRKTYLNPKLDITDTVRGINMQIPFNDHKKAKRLVKSCIKDIAAWQGLNNSRKWPKMEKFKDSAIGDIEFTITATL